MSYQPTKEICESSIPHDPTHLNKKYYQNYFNGKIICEDCLKLIYDEFATMVDSLIQEYKKSTTKDYALSNWYEVHQHYSITVMEPSRVLGVETIEVDFKQEPGRPFPEVLSIRADIDFQGIKHPGSNVTHLAFSLTSGYNYDALRMMIEQTLSAQIFPFPSRAVKFLEHQPDCPVEKRC